MTIKLVSLTFATQYGELVCGKTLLVLQFDVQNRLQGKYAIS